MVQPNALYAARACRGKHSVRDVPSTFTGGNATDCIAPHLHTAREAVDVSRPVLFAGYLTDAPFPRPRAFDKTAPRALDETASLNDYVSPRRHQTPTLCQDAL